MIRPASPHDSREGGQEAGRSPSRKRSERALQLAQAINPGLGECITIGSTERQMNLFDNTEPPSSAPDLVVERDPEADGPSP